MLAQVAQNHRHEATIMIDVDELERLARAAVGDEAIKIHRDELLFLINRYREVPDLTSEGRAIPAPALHGCQIRGDMRLVDAAAAFDARLSSPVSPNQARYRSAGTMRDCRTKIKALNKFSGRTSWALSTSDSSQISADAALERSQPLD